MSAADKVVKWQKHNLKRRLISYLSIQIVSENLHHNHGRWLTRESVVVIAYWRTWTHILSANRTIYDSFLRNSRHRVSIDRDVSAPIRERRRSGLVHLWKIKWCNLTTSKTDTDSVDHGSQVISVTDWDEYIPQISNTDTLDADTLAWGL